MSLPPTVKDFPKVNVWVESVAALRHFRSFAAVGDRSFLACLEGHGKNLSRLS